MEMIVTKETSFSLTVLKDSMKRIAGRYKALESWGKRSHRAMLETPIWHSLTCNKLALSCRPAILGCSFLQFLQVFDPFQN